MKNLLVISIYHLYRFLLMITYPVLNEDLFMYMIILPQLMNENHNMRKKIVQKYPSLISKVWYDIQLSTVVILQSFVLMFR